MKYILEITNRETPLNEFEIKDLIDNVEYILEETLPRDSEITLTPIIEKDK